MATIIIKNSTGSGVIPSSLQQGELAINTKDGKLYYGSGSGNVVKEFTAAVFPYTGSATITGSLIVTGSTTSTLGFTGSLQGTASWAINALTASFVPNYVITASVSSNTITFTKGNGSTFPITVNTGSGGGAQKIYNFIQSSDGIVITGTTNTTLTSATLIPANTVAVGDSISLKVRAVKVGTAGTSRVFVYANTSSSISGATLLASGPNAAAVNIYHQLSREFVVSSSTATQGFPSGTALITDDVNTSVTITNSDINWTADQYFVFAINNASAADATETTYARVTVLKP